MAVKYREVLSGSTTPSSAWINEKEWKKKINTIDLNKL